MGWGNAVAAGINQATEFTTTAANIIAQARANKKNYRYQRDLNQQLFEYQKDLNAQANQYNLDMAEYTYNKNLEQWNRENLYNSPVEQMKRFKEAGLNPHLIYGQQNYSAGSPQMQTPQGQFDAPHGIVAPKHNAVNIHIARLGDALKEYYDLKSMEEDVKSKEYANEYTSLSRPYWGQQLTLNQWKQILETGASQEDWFNALRNNKVAETLEGITRYNPQIGEDIFSGKSFLDYTNHNSYNSQVRNLDKVARELTNSSLGLSNKRLGLLNTYQEYQNEYQNSFLKFQNKMLKEKSDLLDKLSNGSFQDLNSWETNMRLMSLSLFDQSVNTMYGRELDGLGDVIGNVFGGIGKGLKGFLGNKKDNGYTEFYERVSKDKNGSYTRSGYRSNLRR